MSDDNNNTTTTTKDCKFVIRYDNSTETILDHRWVLLYEGDPIVSPLALIDVRNGCGTVETVGLDWYLEQYDGNKYKVWEYIDSREDVVDNFFKEVVDYPRIYWDDDQPEYWEAAARLGLEVRIENGFGLDDYPYEDNNSVPTWRDYFLRWIDLMEIVSSVDYESGQKIQVIWQGYFCYRYIK